MLRKLFIFLLIVLGLILAALSVAIYFIAEDTPLVKQTVQIEEAERTVLEQILEQNRPGTVVTSNLKNISLSTKQMNQLLQYAGERYYPNLKSYVSPNENRFNLRLTYKLPENPLGKYINIDANLRIQYSKYIVFNRLKLGRLTIPPVMVTILQPFLLEELTNRHGEYIALWNYLRRIDLSSKGVVVHYRLERSDLAQVKKISRKIMVNTETRDRVVSYTKELSRITNSLPATEQSVVNVLRPMFNFARLETEKSNKAVEENKILMLVLGVYISGKNPEKFVLDKPEHTIKNIPFTLSERRDLAQHYMISSAINALSGTRWATTIGLEKEIEDSKTGSGFSFVDLMADIAGNKLAQAALNNKTAEKIQAIMSDITSEDVIFARINGLDEGLTENEFRMEYGTTNSDEYISVVREIERRLFRCEAYR